MSKATYDNGDPLGILTSLNGQDKQPLAKPTPANNDPLGILKKKADGDGSSNGGQPVSLSISQSQLPSETAQKWNNKDASARDVQAVAKTDAGKQLGVDVLNTKDQRQQYADAHNMGTMSDVFTKVKGLTDTWATTLKQNNPAPLQAQLKNKDTGTQVDNLVQGVKTGDPDAIYAFKNNVTEALQKQIDDLQKSNADKALHRVPSYTDVALGGATMGTSSAPRTAKETQDQIASLQGQIKDVTDSYNKYAELSLVNQAEKMPGGIHNSTNAMWVGRNLRRLNESTKEFKEQQNLKPNTSPWLNNDDDAITERNYLDEKNGMDAIINQRGMMQAQNHIDAVQNKNVNNQNQADTTGGELAILISKRNLLSQKYLPVKIYNTAKVIGDQLSTDNVVSGDSFNIHYTKDQIDGAVANLSKKNPDFYKANKEAIDFIIANPGNIPERGFTGGLERGVEEGIGKLSWIIGTDKNEAAEKLKEQFDAEKQGTKYAGKMTTKVVLDQKGQGFAELPNENYDKHNFNSIVGNAGEFVGNAAVYAALTEGSGALIGGAVEGVAGIANATKVADAFSAGNKARQVSGVMATQYMMSYEDNMKIATSLIKDDSEHGGIKKSIVANALTLTQGALMNILPANVLLKRNIMEDVGGDVIKTLAENDAQGITKPVMTSIMDKVKERIPMILNASAGVLSDAAKADAEMIAINHGNAIINSLFDETGATKKNDVLQEDINTFRDVSIGVLAMGGVRVLKSPFGLTQRDALYEAAMNGDEYVQRIQTSIDDGVINRDKGNQLIKIIKTAQLHLPTVLDARVGNEADPESEGSGLPLSLRQRKGMLAEKVRSSMLAEHTQANPDDPELKKAQSGADKGYQEIKYEVPYLPLQIEAKGNETDQTQNAEATTPAENKVTETETPKVAETGNAKVEPADENTISVKEMMDKKGSYNGQEGQFYQDGQTVVFKTDGGKKEYELGNINDIGEHSIKDYRIEQQQSVVGADEKGNLTVRGEKYTNPFEERGQSPLDAVTYDKDGNVVNVRLKTDDGERRTFRGNIAEDLAYQIHLKEIDKNNEQRQVEDFINNDPESREAVNDARPSETPEGGSGENPEQVQRTKIKRRVISSKPKTDTNENEKSNGQVPQERVQANERQQGQEGGSQSQEESGNAGRPVGQEQSVLTGKGAAEAEPEEVAPSQLAQETKENHLEAIRNLEKREDRISPKDLENPEQVKKPVLKNIAAKELGKEKLSEAEQKIAEARRADIDDIKVNDEAKRFEKRMSDDDRQKRDLLNDKVALIDKYGIEDIVKQMIDNKQIEKICE